MKIWWLVRFLHVQLFITLMAMPILIAWGLPISALSPLGNLFFSPLLTAFLLLSSLLFFTELVCLPNGLIVTCLEWLTTIWYRLLMIADQRFLLGFAKPNPFILIALPLITVLILLHPRTRGVIRSTLYFAALITLTTGYLHFIARPRTQVCPIECNTGTVHLLRDNHELMVVDPGYIGRRLSAASWAQYTLTPHIVKTMGTTTIDHLVLMQPGTLLFEAIEQLLTKVSIKNIYLVSWDGSLSRSGNRAYYFLKKAAEQRGCNLIRIGRYPRRIMLGTTSVHIEPLETIIKKQGYTLPALRLSTCIDNETITLYAAHYVRLQEKSTYTKQQTRQS